MLWMWLQNVVVYSGSSNDRKIIRDHEFGYPNGAKGALRFNVLLTSYETVLRDKSVFTGIDWETVIIDEAHRMKVWRIQNWALAVGHPSHDEIHECLLCSGVVRDLC